MVTTTTTAARQKHSHCYLNNTDVVLVSVVPLSVNPNSNFLYHIL